MEILTHIDDEVFDRIKYHLRHELVLYAHALSLILEQYTRIVDAAKAKEVLKTSTVEKKQDMTMRTK